jgi:hypothetical protein
MTTRMTCKSLKRGKGEVKSYFPFFKYLLFIFEFLFYFIKCKGEKNQICSGKREKKMVDLGVREKIQTQMVEEGWKIKWDNYRFTSRWELHVYSPRARLSPYLWRLIHRCDWRSCRNRRGFFSGVSPNEFHCWLPPDILQMTQCLCLISDDTSKRGLISSKILPIIMLLVVVNDQKESWLVTPWVEALIWTKTIAGVHALIGRGAIATHMTYLTSWSISLQLYGEDSCEKASFWSNNISCPNQTRNGTQVAGDPKVPFPRSIMANGGGESPFVSKPCIVHTIMVDDINLTSPRDLSLAMRWTSWDRVWIVHHLGLGYKTIFSMKWSSCLNINMSVDCSTQPKKNSEW